MKISRKEAAEKLDQIFQAKFGILGVSQCVGKVIEYDLGEKILQFEECSRKGIYRLRSAKYHYSIACCAAHASNNVKSDFDFKDETVFHYEMAVGYTGNGQEDEKSK